MLVVAGCSSGDSPSSEPSELQGAGQNATYQGFGMTTPQPRPNFELVDQTGKKFSFGQKTAGHPTLLFFGYTNCPDICPTTMADVGQALRSVSADDAKQTYVVFVTTDVKRDKPAVLATWIRNFSGGTQGATFVGLSGTQAQVDAAQAAAHITVAEDNGQTHSSRTLLYGKDDYARVSFAQSAQLSKQISHDLTLVSKG